MRDYGKVTSKFWIGTTGRELRGNMEAQIVAAYLITSPHSNMIGLYYLPAMFLAHETGLSIEGAWKGLRRAIEAGFCSYDEASEVVWVHEMARFQIGDALKAEDKRCVGIQREYDDVPQCIHLKAFFEKYGDAFHLTKCRGCDSPFEAPSKPLRSQEQEQEQEQEQKEAGSSTLASDVAVEVKPDLDECWSAETIAYLRCGSANTEKSVRSMMGQWLKRHEPSEVIETIRSAEASCAAQPLPWVNKALGNRIAERKAGVAPFAPRKPAEPSGLVGALVRLNREAGHG